MSFSQQILCQKKMQVMLSALCLPDFAIHAASALHRCQLTTMDQDIPFHKIPLIRDWRNCMKSCILVNLYLTITARISSSSWVSRRQIAVSFLSKGISSTVSFHKSIGTDNKSIDTDRTQTTFCTASECQDRSLQNKSSTKCNYIFKVYVQDHQQFLRT